MMRFAGRGIQFSFHHHYNPKLEVLNDPTDRCGHRIPGVQEALDFITYANDSLVPCPVKIYNHSRIHLLKIDIEGYCMKSMSLMPC
jgi:hypothetical protein